jgi:hypothetical protein
MFEYLLLNMIERYLMNDMNKIHEDYLNDYICKYSMKNFEKKISIENFHFLDN